MGDAPEPAEKGRFVWYDLLVVILAACLVGFLIVTMGIRTHAARLEEQCQERLLVLAQAQQLYLVKNGRFADSLVALRPFLEPGKEEIPFVCPITGNELQVKVQGDRYMIVAPGTEFSITTGDPSW
jgi:hypothetical protein